MTCVANTKNYGNPYKKNYVINKSITSILIYYLGIF